jgi:hypothetical protein
MEAVEFGRHFRTLEKRGTSIIIPPQRNAKISRHGNSSSPPLSRDPAIREIRQGDGTPCWRRRVNALPLRPRTVPARGCSGDCYVVDVPVAWGGDGGLGLWPQTLLADPAGGGRFLLAAMPPCVDGAGGCVGRSPGRYAAGALVWPLGLLGVLPAGGQVPTRPECWVSVVQVLGAGGHGANPRDVGLGSSRWVRQPPGRSW